MTSTIKLYQILYSVSHFPVSFPHSFPKSFMSFQLDGWEREEEDKSTQAYISCKAPDTMERIKHPSPYSGQNMNTADLHNHKMLQTGQTVASQVRSQKTLDFCFALLVHLFWGKLPWCHVNTQGALQRDPWVRNWGLLPTTSINLSFTCVSHLGSKLSSPSQAFL